MIWLRLYLYFPGFLAGISNSSIISKMIALYKLECRKSNAMYLARSSSHVLLLQCEPPDGASLKSDIVPISMLKAYFYLLQVNLILEEA